MIEARHNRSIIPILLYHSVSDDVGYRFRPFSLRPNDFKAHMDYLSGNGYRVLNMEQFVNQRANLPEKTVVITFDDGFRDFYDYALPILADYRMPATIYVPTAFVGKTSQWLADMSEGSRPIMSWNDLKDAASSGIEIGAHTLTHPQLDVIPLQQAQTEISLSKFVIEENLQHKVNSFAYPYGYHTSQLIEYVRLLGFTSACAVKNALSHSFDNPFCFARITIMRHFDTDKLADILAATQIPLAKDHEALRTSAWRIIRRLRFAVSGV